MKASESSLHLPIHNSIGYLTTRNDGQCNRSQRPKYALSSDRERRELGFDRAIPLRRLEYSALIKAFRFLS